MPGFGKKKAVFRRFSIVFLHKEFVASEMVETVKPFVLVELSIFGDTVSGFCVGSSAPLFGRTKEVKIR